MKSLAQSRAKSAASAPGAGSTALASVDTVLNRPQSRGKVSLQDADPASPPAVDGRWLSHPDDVATQVCGLRKIRELVAAGPFAELVAEVLNPPDLLSASDEALAAFKATLVGVPRAHVTGVFLETTPQRTLQLIRQYNTMGAEDTAKALDARDFWDPVWKFRCRQCPAALRLDFEEAFLYRPPEVRQDFVDLLPGLVALGNDEMAARMRQLADALLAMPVFGTAAEVGPHCVTRMTLDLYALYCPAPV